MVWSTYNAYRPVVGAEDIFPSSLGPKDVTHYEFLNGNTRPLKVDVNTWLIPTCLPFARVKLPHTTDFH
jgi:hypothetical protein